MLITILITIIASIALVVWIHFDDKLAETDPEAWRQKLPGCYIVLPTPSGRRIQVGWWR